MLSSQQEELPLAQHALIENIGRLRKEREEQGCINDEPPARSGEKRDRLAELVIVHREASCERLMEE